MHDAYLLATLADITQSIVTMVFILIEVNHIAKSQIRHLV